MLSSLKLIFVSMLIAIAAAQSTLSIKANVIYVGNQWNPSHISFIRDFFSKVSDSSWFYPIRTTYGFDLTLVLKKTLTLNVTAANNTNINVAAIVQNAIANNWLEAETSGIYMVLSDVTTVTGLRRDLNDFYGTYSRTPVNGKQLETLWVESNGYCGTKGYRSPNIGLMMKHVSDFVWRAILNIAVPGNDLRRTKCIEPSTLADYKPDAQTCFAGKCNVEFGGIPWSLSRVYNKKADICHQGLNDTEWKQQASIGYAGAALETLSKPSSGLQDCGIQCAENAACVGFTFDRATGKCILRSDMSSGQASSTIDSFLYKRRTCPGKTASDFGKKCAPCPEGTIYNGAKKTCDICPAGKWSTAGATKCSVACPAGSICKKKKTCPTGHVAASGATSCAQCKAGQVPDATKAKCVACNGTTYSNSGDAACKSCNAGFECKNGIATRCAAGKVSASGVGNFSACDAGKVPDGTNAACVACIGTTWSNSGDAACKSCPQGSVCQNGLAKTCTAGQVPNAAQTQCVNQTSGQPGTPPNGTNTTSNISSNSTNSTVSTTSTSATNSSNSNSTNSTQSTVNSTRDSTQTLVNSESPSSAQTADDSGDSSDSTPTTDDSVDVLESAATTSCTKCLQKSSDAETIQHGNSKPSVSFSTQPHSPATRNGQTSPGEPIGQTEVVSAAHQIVVYLSVTCYAILFL